MPLVGSGLGAQLGIAAESVYGTYVAPTRFQEFSSEELKRIKNVFQGGGLAAGRPAQLGARRKVTSQAAEGPIDMEFTNKLMGVWLNQLFGGTPTITQQAATAAYLQVHTLQADNAGKSFSAQIGVPRTSAVTDAYTFKGAKVVGAEFKCELDGALTVKWDLDVRQVDEAQTLGVASYSLTTAPFHWGQAALKLGASYGTEAQVDGVREVSLKIERKQATDRFYQGKGGLKDEPITNDYLAVSGSITADYLDKSVFVDRYSNDTAASFLWEFTGPIIASTFAERVSFKVPQIFLEGDTPTVGGPEIVSGEFPFTAQSDGTNGLAIVEYMSTDTVI